VVSGLGARRAVPGISGGEIRIVRWTDVGLRRCRSEQLSESLDDGVPMNRSGGAFDFAKLTNGTMSSGSRLSRPARRSWGSDAPASSTSSLARDGADRKCPPARAGTFGTLAGEPQVSHASAAATSRLAWPSRIARDLSFNITMARPCSGRRATPRVDEKTDSSFTCATRLTALTTTDGTGGLWTATVQHRPPART